MQKIAKPGIISLLVITALAALLLNGCASDKTQSSQSAADQSGYENSLSAAMTAQESLKSYQYDVVLNMDMEIAGGETPGKMSMKTGTSGGYDITAKEMSMEMTMSMTGEVLGENQIPEAGYAMYLTDNWAYMMVNVPGMDKQWMKTDASGVDDDVFSSSVDEQLTMLDSPAGVKYLRSEKIDGVNCAVLSIEVTQAQLAQWYDDQESTKLATGTNYADIFKNFKILCYVAEETNLLMRMTLEMTMELTPEQADLVAGSFDKMTTVVWMDMKIRDHNKPFSVTLPDDAADATEVSADTFNSIKNQ
jgi:hypothetical protein